jgi:hypothetical protein
MASSFGLRNGRTHSNELHDSAYEDPNSKHLTFRNGLTSSNIFKDREAFGASDTFRAATSKRQKSSASRSSAEGIVAESNTLRQSSSNYLLPPSIRENYAVETALRY